MPNATNLVPAFVPSQEAITGCFSPYVYNYEGSHIQKLLNVCIGQNGGAGELLNNSLIAWLNEAMPSSTTQYCTGFVTSIFPILAFLTPAPDSSPAYYKTRLWNIISALSIGFTEVGVQRLSQGIFNSRCIYSENNGVVTVQPLCESYTPIQAMVFQTIARRIAPPQIGIWVAPCQWSENLISTDNVAYSTMEAE